MAISLEDAIQRFHGAGMRMTRTRESLLRLVLASREPFSVRALHERAEKIGLDIHLATVHRNLAEFVDVGLVDKLPGEDNNLYALHEDREAGAHVFCLDCRKTVPLETPTITDASAVGALSKALMQHGFDASTVRLMLAAHCATRTCDNTAPANGTPEALPNDD